MPRKRKSEQGGHVDEGASRNGLQEAILGLLAIRPMSGYDVARSYTRALQQIWYAPQGQVYPTLRRMHAQGLLDVSVEVQEDRPNRKVYSLTTSGRLQLVEWLSHPATLPRMHHEFIHKLFLLNQIDPAKQREFVLSYAERSATWAKELRAIEKNLHRALKGAYRESVWFQLVSLGHLIRIVECEAKSAKGIAEELSKRAKVRSPRGGAGRSLEQGAAFGGLSLSPTNQRKSLPEGRDSASSGERQR